MLQAAAEASATYRKAAELLAELHQPEQALSLNTLGLPLSLCHERVLQRQLLRGSDVHLRMGHRLALALTGRPLLSLRLALGLGVWLALGLRLLLALLLLGLRRLLRSLLGGSRAWRLRRRLLATGRRGSGLGPLGSLVLLAGLRRL